MGKKTDRKSVDHKNLKVSTADTKLLSKVRRDNGEGPLLQSTAITTVLSILGLVLTAPRSQMVNPTSVC